VEAVVGCWPPGERGHGSVQVIARLRSHPLPRLQPSQACPNGTRSVLIRNTGMVRSTSPYTSCSTRSLTPDLLPTASERRPPARRSFQNPFQTIAGPSGEGILASVTEVGRSSMFPVTLGWSWVAWVADRAQQSLVVAGVLLVGGSDQDRQRYGRSPARPASRSLPVDPDGDAFELRCWIKPEAGVTAQHHARRRALPRSHGRVLHVPATDLGRCPRASESGRRC
jgi:hypothetical protein